MLRDCYLKWPQQQVTALARYYVEQAALDCDFEQFMVWFDWTGMQRHMKAIGIFARLNKLHRKPGYLRDIPRTINYLIDASSQYPELSNFNSLLTSKIMPAIARSFIGVSV